MSGHPADPLGGNEIAERVVRGGAVRVVGFVATNVVAASATILLLRHLGVADFGRYGTVLALMTIVGGITDAGLNLVGTRELSLVCDGEPRRALTAAILGIRLVLAVAGASFAVAFALVAGYDDEMVVGTALAGLGVVGIAGQSSLSLPALVALRNVRLSMVDVSRALVQLAGIGLLVALSASLLAFLALQIAVGWLVLALFPLIFGRAILVAPRYDAERWKHVIRAALPVAVAGVLAVLYLRIVVVFASLLVDDVQTGLLVTSARIVEVISGLPLLLSGVVLPVATVAARDDPARLRYVAQRMLEGGVLLGTLTALVLGFGAQILVVALGGEQYRAAASVLAIQGVVTVTIFVVQACIVVLIATHRQGDIAWANVLGLVFITVAALILLPVEGARGGAIAAVVADTGLAATMLVMVRRAGVRLQLGALPRIALAAALAILAGLIPGLPAMVATVLAVVVFSSTCLALHAIPPEVLAIRSLRSR